MHEAGTHHHHVDTLRRDGVAETLREAVELSNKNPGEDAIAFAESMNGATVVLDSGELTLDDDVIVN